MDLFNAANNSEYWRETICPDALVLRQYALAKADDLLQAIEAISQQSPFRIMKTPGGLPMSAALSSCGDYGWVSDRHGYRYSRHDPISHKPWPAMPEQLKQFAQQAAKQADYPNFNPDACLINRYDAGAKMSLHQDKDERDFSAPIVSISLGVPATFYFGGLQRSDKTLKVPLIHGDVVVWGKSARLNFHGIAPIKHDYHPATGQYRYNITFRKAR